MNRLDAIASGALSAEIVKPVWLAYLDIFGDPVRANSSGADMTITGTGDVDMDGHQFIGISHSFVDISAVSARQGGSNTVTATLSGIAGLDADTLALIGDKANWQGRPARLWRIIRNAANVQQGAVQHYYTGYMTALTIGAQPDQQSITVSIETYLAAFSQASNRTYLDQERYDPGDLSARASIAIANGNTGNPITGGTPTGSSGGGGSLVNRPGVQLV